MRRLYKTTSRYYKINNIKKICEEVTKECILCQRNKNYKNIQSHLYGFLLARKPLEKIFVDLYGPCIYDKFKHEDDKGAF